ncbi:hypothetical protein PTW35_23800 (plasmid) [Photobacterium sp. DA100]|uniref:hypothetical protein n=1 Tax=Photobacterium sp. DA100 TaxID=3027472 RepID=UPI00247A413E|nr:hypothetical protein [Photobacterium sp. DA100]WEM44310.1 hypothetical protein PTW35_23800 [Photobacterium sp. DA100]
MATIKTVIASGLLLLSGTALADIKIADTHSGAWISVSHDGSPIKGAEVTVKNVPQQKSTFSTNENGRVFIPLTLENSRSIKYEVIKPGTNTTETRIAFHSSNK